MAALLLLFAWADPAAPAPAAAAEARRVEVKAREAAAPEHRIALVIGNAAYRVGPLRNPVNDARAVAAALRELGFEVEERTDLTYQEMGRAIVRFGQAIRRDSVALFYYAGHGLQVQGSNYLVPVDAQIHDEGEVPFATVHAGLVLAKMEEARNPVNIVILDACRDNPYARTWKRSSGGRGLAKMDAPVGSIIAYAAGPGETADDGKGENGLYTESLIRQMKTPDLKIEDVFKRVRTEVRQKSGGRQVPAETTQLEGDFYFARAIASAAAPAPPALAMARPPAPPPAPSAPRAGEIARDGATGMEMVFVPGGCFPMGDATGDGEADEKPVHEVCVRDLYVGRYEVTGGQFKQFVAETGYRTDAERNVGKTGCYALGDKGFDWQAWASWKNPNKDLASQDDHPVSCVSWNDAKAFAEWLSRKGGAPYRLPTEAEWEHAARGGTTTRNYWGNGKDDACAYANVLDRTLLPPGASGDFSGSWIQKWVPKHECADGQRFAAPVGRFKPNAFGLYDTIGNLWEWTQDGYGQDYYTRSPRDNPAGPPSEPRRVVRGAGWRSPPRDARAANRGSGTPELRSSDFGFRLVRTP